MRVMHPRRLAAAVIVALAVGASASAAELRTIPVPTGGFAIGLPSSWVDVTSAAPSVLEKLEKVPTFRAFAQAASQNGSLKLIAADPASKGSVYMDIGCARVGRVPLGAVASADRKALKQTLGKGGSVTSEKREARRRARLRDPPARGRARRTRPTSTCSSTIRSST